uniref:Uncharacterized protein n=1 Tax=Lotharella globosa TaxID=91324 RepID=A0A7S3Z8U5_9EUKA
MAANEPTPAPLFAEITTPSNEFQLQDTPLFEKLFEKSPETKKGRRSRSARRAKPGASRRILRVRSRLVKGGPSTSKPEADERKGGQKWSLSAGKKQTVEDGTSPPSLSPLGTEEAPAWTRKLLNSNLMTYVRTGSTDACLKCRDYLHKAQPFILAQALRQASLYGELEMVRILVDKTPVDVNKGSASTGMTALMLAAQAGHLGVVRYLTRTRRCTTDINQANHNGLTALCWALLQGELEVVKELVFYAKADIGWDDEGRDATFFYRYKRGCGNKELVDKIFAAAAGLRPLRRDTPMITMLHQEITRATLDI